MLYFRITAYTPVVGQEATEFLKVADPLHALYYGEGLAIINGINNYETTENTIPLEEFINKCNCFLEEITRKEYEEFNI
jgi:hypothetical protein